MSIRALGLILGLILGRRQGRRGERGATTAEYVGIVAFAAVLTVALITVVNTPVSQSTRAVIDGAFCKIGKTIGVYSGCGNSQIPQYVPKQCTVSSDAKTYGGSIAIVAEVGGDTGYTILRIRTRNDDGSYSDKYVVQTSGKISGSYTFGPGGSAEGGAGGEAKGGGGGAKVKLDGNLSTGSSYTFDSEAAAKKFADDNKAKFGIDGLVSGGPEPDSTYYQGGAGVGVSGEAGPLSGQAGVSGVLGVTLSKDGSKTFQVALTGSAAAQLGIPIPASLMQASASGEISLTVTANVTFDKDGHLTALAGSLNLTGQAQAGVQLAKYKRYEGKHETKSHNTLDGFNLPQIPALQKGASATLTFSTNFTDAKGNYDATQAGAIGDTLKKLVTGQGVDESSKEALSNQLLNHSQTTFQLNDYNKETQSYGGKVHILVVSIGAEYHVITTKQRVIDGWYLDPTTGQWEHNVACEGAA